MATRRPARASFLLLALALAACSGPQTDVPEAQATAPATASGEPAPPQANAQAYYEGLVAQYGQDYAACVPSQRTLPAQCAAAADVPGTGSAGSNVLLMLDASGSMAARIGGETKMKSAQDALAAFAGKLPATAKVALRVYGHTGNNQASGKAESCAGTELLYPFQKADAGKFETAIRSFKPTGWTPIAASLEAAAQDFASSPSRNGANVVYVVSDGIETCDADPVQAARKLHESDIDVVVNVIGFDVDAEAARQLQAVAKAGGGEYIVANTREDLNRVFSERWNEAQKRFNCVWGERQTAFNQTWDAQQKRFNCLWGKAQDEFNAVWGHSQEEFNSTWQHLNADEGMDPEIRRARLEEAEVRRAYAQKQADAKRARIQKSADAERARVQDSADNQRSQAQSTADAERAQAQRSAEQERNADGQ